MTLYMLHRPLEVDKVGLTREEIVTELSAMPGVPSMSGLPERLESAPLGEWLIFPSLPGVLVMPYSSDPTDAPDVQERHTVTVTKVEHTVPEVVMKHPVSDADAIVAEATSVTTDRLRKK